MKELNKYTLITGASTGLGRKMAEECANQGRNLILTALPNENIEGVGADISRIYKVKVKCYEVDLTKEGAVEQFAEAVLEKYTVNVLVNNAGVGGTKPFLEASASYIDQIVMLNMRALVILTRLLLPELKKHKQAHILNIASMASFGPMPYKTVYPASKAFVYSFSRGLSAELKGTGVCVSVAHPGGMRTNTEVTERINKHSKLVQATTVSVKRVAEICIRQMLKKERIIIPGRMNKVCFIILKIIPVWLRLNIMRNSLQNELKNSDDIIQAA